MSERPTRRWIPSLGVRIVGLVVTAQLLFWVVAFVVLSPVIFDGPRRRSPDSENLKALVTMHLARSKDRNQGFARYTGKAFVLSVIADGTLDPQVEGATDVFFSPRDSARSRRPSAAEYATLSHERLAAGGDLSRFTSHVGRRNADPDAALGKNYGPDEPIIADLRHREDGAMVGFAGGRVEFLKRDELGLGPDDPMVAGPTSRSPILRLLGE